MRLAGLSIVCLCGAISTWSAPAHARDAVVTSFDGTRLVVHFYAAGGPAAGARAPTVLAGPASPQARDISALIDFGAAQPEALLDAAGDPRVRMSGSSYGGGIQSVSAGIDQRIDAIVPDIAWNSLLTSFFRDGAVKRRNDVPVKMVWYCGGNGHCPTPRGDARYLALPSWRGLRAGSSAIPASTRARDLNGSPTMASGAPDRTIRSRAPARLTPPAPARWRCCHPTGSARGSSSCLPTADGVSVPFARPPSASDVIGEPRVKLVYRGSAVPSRTFVYAQVVDAGRVAGGQATPIPVVLDGRTRTIERALETLAVHVRHGQTCACRSAPE